VRLWLVRTRVYEAVAGRRFEVRTPVDFGKKNGARLLKVEVSEAVVEVCDISRRLPFCVRKSGVGTAVAVTLLPETPE